MNSLPSPIRVEKEILPLYVSIMFFIIGSPRPIPLVLVVNLGSKILLSIDSVIPLPLSLTSITTSVSSEEIRILIFGVRSSGID